MRTFKWSLRTFKHAAAGAFCALMAAVLAIVGLAAVPAQAINAWGTANLDVSQKPQGSFISRPVIAASADGTKLVAVWRLFENSKFGLASAVATVSNNVQTWSTPATFAAPVSGNFDFPQVVMSQDGTRATALWTDSASKSLQSASATITSNAISWGSITALPNPPSTFSYSTPRFKATPDGSKLFAGWISAGLGESQGMAAAGTVSGTTVTWETPSVISSTAATTKVNSVTPVLSADGTKATVLFSQGATVNVSDPFSLISRSAAITAGTSTWGDLTSITTNTGTSTSTNPSAVLSADGSQITVAWREATYGTAATNDLLSVSGTITDSANTWGPPTTLDSQPGDANADYWPQVSGSADAGSVTALWFRSSGNSRTVVSASGTVSGTAQTWGTVSAALGTAGNSTQYDIAVASNRGNTIAIAVWAHSNTVESATAAISGTTQTWAAGTTLGTGNGVTFGASRSGLRASVMWTASGNAASIAGGTSDPVPTATAIAPSSGPVAGGTTVTITGTDLEDAVVTIDGNNCLNVVIDPAGTSLTCEVPAGAAGSVNVVVTTDGGAVTMTGGVHLPGGPDGNRDIASHWPGGRRHDRHDHGLRP